MVRDICARGGWSCKERLWDLQGSVDISVYWVRHGLGEALGKVNNKECEYWEAAGTSLCHSSFQQEEEKFEEP